MDFYTGNMFPEEYKNQIIIAEHGSWNRSSKIGYRLTPWQSYLELPCAYFRLFSVIPVKTGIQRAIGALHAQRAWIPACAGMTEKM